MKRIACLLIVLLCCVTCKKGGSDDTADTGNANTGGTTGGTTTTFFAKGADVSWLTQMEASNYKFYNNSGTQQDCMQILKDKGMNSIRLRVWVNPTDGWCNTADLIVKAKRVSALGMKILLDFHYSDSWADPGKQPKPAAWASQSFATLQVTVHDYTQSVMNTLKTNGITPDWVQVGNETNDGMLWEDGRASTNMANFAKLITAGYQGVKDVSSTTPVIVHISNGYDNNLFRWMFDGLKNNGAKWDIIGMSLYPSASNWQTYNTQCLANMNDMITRYGKPVMICETGFASSDAVTAKAFLTDLINKTKSISNGNGLGVFYWEPEAYNWMSYGLGTFDNTGKPTVALDAFN
ncbi:MAG: glycosyl hydrolase 53 family protein [Bacteroidota bacterium]